LWIDTWYKSWHWLTIRWWNSNLLAKVSSLHSSSIFEIGYVLLKNRQVLYESSIEVRTLRKHVFKILLTHESKVNSLEEGLTSWIDGDRSLKLGEVIEILLDNRVGTLDDFVLFSKFSEF
jgi:hypothetical protein